METPKIKRPHEVADMPRAIYLYERGELTPSEVQKIATKAITQDRASLHTSLVAAVKETKEFMAVASSPEFEMGYQMAIKDYEERVLTIINSIFKE